MNASGLRLEVKFRLPTISNFYDWITSCIEELLAIAQRELQIEPQDKVGIIFTNTNHTKVDFSITFRPFNQNSTDLILFQIDKVIQSNTLFFADDNLVINFDHARIPVGYGQRRTHTGKNSDKYYKLHKRSIFSPKLRSEDYGMCLAVSIVVGMAHLSDDINRYNYLTYTGNYNELIQEARMLC